MSTRHKVFVSYHHAGDQQHRNLFERLFANTYGIMISQSVQIGDIGPNLQTETIRQKIRDGYLRDSTVTVVLIGEKTWQRKHVDWEIGASIRNTRSNPRSGLLGILLPSHPSYYSDTYSKCIIPPRLHDNVKCGYAKIYNWSNDPSTVQSWIHDAFESRDKINPDNSYNSFVNNRSGEGW